MVLLRSRPACALLFGIRQGSIISSCKWSRGSGVAATLARGGRGK